MYGFAELSDWVPPGELDEVASDAPCALVVDLMTGDEDYVSDRLWLALGMGAVVVKRRSPGQPCEHLYRSYGTVEELLGHAEQVKLMSTEERQREGRRCRAEVFESHLYEHRLMRLLWSVHHRRDYRQPFV